MQRPIICLLSAFSFAALAAPRTQAQSADALIDKLVDKGILTVKEANELREETDKGFNSAYSVKSGLPEWVTSLKIGGDVRARYDGIYHDDPASPDRSRFRYRVRPSIVATLKDDLEVGLRLTSAEPRDSFGGDPISGNVSYGDNGSKKFIYIDQVYAKWTALNTPLWNGSLTVGKMENPFVFSDMVFDPDYTPEGFAEQVSFAITDDQKLQLNLGQFVLDEIGASSSDPYMFGAQLRLDSTWTPKITTSAGIAALLITSEEQLRETGATTINVQPVDAAGNPMGAPRPVTVTGASSAVPNVNAGNTRVGGILTQDYNPVVADASITYTLDDFYFYNAPFPIRLAGDFIHNPGADDRNNGYSIGITFGKSGKKGLWDASYRWKHLEGDAWYEELVDSDFGAVHGSPGGGRIGYQPGTNMEGHIFRVNYSLYDSLTFGITYFLTQAIDEVPAGYDKHTGRILVDAIWKF